MHASRLQHIVSTGCQTQQDTTKETNARICILLDLGYVCVELHSIVKGFIQNHTCTLTASSFFDHILSSLMNTLL